MTYKKNGVELVLTLQLALELLEEYPAKQLLKKQITKTKESIEKDINKSITAINENNGGFVQNAINYKEKLIKNIAELDESGCILLSSFVERNMDKIRESEAPKFNKINVN